VPGHLAVDSARGGLVLSGRACGPPAAPRRLRPIAEAWAAGLPPDDPPVSELVARTRAELVDHRERPGALHVFPLLPTPEGGQARQAMIEAMAANLRGAMVEGA